MWCRGLSQPVKDHGTQQRLESLDKRLAPGQYTPQQRVMILAPLHHRVEQESQQVEVPQKRREVLLAMTKVVLQMVPLGLGDVIVCVCALPPPTP